MAGGTNKGKHHKRTIDKINFAIRLMVGCPHLSSTQIATMIGVTPGRLSLMQRLPLYTKIHAQYVSGVITDLDSKVDANYDLTRKQLDFAVPLAMQTLVQQALNSKDERVKNKAANDILDRDGHFAKVSRLGIATKEQGGVTNEKDNDDAAALLQALNEAKAGSPGLAAMTVNNKTI